MDVLYVWIQLHVRLQGAAAPEYPARHIPPAEYSLKQLNFSSIKTVTDHSTFSTYVVEAKKKNAVTGTDFVKKKKKKP